LVFNRADIFDKDTAYKRTIKKRQGDTHDEKTQLSTPIIFELGETFDIGSDTGSGVNDADYLPPFNFDGKLNKLTVKLKLPEKKGTA
jgi:hypothetical protein